MRGKQTACISSRPDGHPDEYAHTNFQSDRLTHPNPIGNPDEHPDRHSYFYHLPYIHGDG